MSITSGVFTQSVDEADDGSGFSFRFPMSVFGSVFMRYLDFFSATENDSFALRAPLALPEQVYGK